MQHPGVPDGRGVLTLAAIDVLRGFDATLATELDCDDLELTRRPGLLVRLLGAEHDETAARNTVATLLRVRGLA